MSISLVMPYGGAPFESVIGRMTDIAGAVTVLVPTTISSILLWQHMSTGVPRRCYVITLVDVARSCPSVQGLAQQAWYAACQAVCRAPEYL